MTANPGGLSTMLNFPGCFLPCVSNDGIFYWYTINKIFASGQSIPDAEHLGITPALNGS